MSTNEDNEQRCVCGHPKAAHTPRAASAPEHETQGVVLACTVAGCACGPGCIHDGFVAAESSTKTEAEALVDAFLAADRTRFLGGDLTFPIQVKAITIYPARTRSRKPVPGSWVRCRLGGKTYVGLFLGDLQRDPIVGFDAQEGLLKVLPDTNPAMWVPTLGRVVWGCESWWSMIRSPEDLKQITDDDIQAQPYVQALQALARADAAAKESNPGEEG